MHIHTKPAVHVVRFLAMGGVYGALVIASFTTASASSWNPTLFVNTEAFQVIDDGDAATNIELRFGDTANEIIRWDVTNNRFQFTDDLYATGNITSSGTLTVDSAIKTKADLTINSDNGAADAVLTFGNDAAAETLIFSDTTNGFIFSDDVEVQGALSGANLTIMAGSDSYVLGKVGFGTTTPEEEIEVIGTMSGNIIHAQDDLTSSGTLTVEGKFSLSETIELTISSDLITVTKSYHIIDTESDASTDDLDTINGGYAGNFLVIQTVDAGRDVTVKHAIGNIFLDGEVDLTLASNADTLTLLFGYKGAWAEISHSNNGP